MACRDLLLTLSCMGLIILPPRLKNANNEKRKRSIPVVKIDQIPLFSIPITNCTFVARGSI